jgi:uncharacterized phage protein (TIGR01671 family)
MRDIKFRVWDGDIMHQDCSMFIEIDDGTVWENDPQEEYHDSLKERHGYTLMQYTGLKDKNGKEIYEGDIIKTTNYRNGRETNGVVKFEADVCESGFNFGSIGWYKDEFEIIGNIYEHPHLLNSK